MNDLKNMNFNVTVTLFTSSCNNSGKRSSHVSQGRVYNQADDQSIIIQLQGDQNTNLPAAGKPILIFLAHDLGLYIISALVGQTNLEGGTVIMQCRNPQQIKYFQRRKNVRVNVNIPVNFSPQPDYSNVMKGTIIDMSVGGLQLEAAESVPAGSVMELVFTLDDTGPLFMDGKVVRVTPKNDKLILGLEFINPDQLFIDGIARFIMSEQIRQKRLGLNVFKIFIVEGTIESQSSTVFSIIQFKDLDISTLQGKKCTGNIMQISMQGLIFQCPLKLPDGVVLEFAVELPRLGQTVIRAVTKDVKERAGSFFIKAEFVSDHEKIKDYLLELLARDFGVPYL